MVNTLLRSLKLLSDVLVFFLFFLIVMALIGLQLFVGELRNKCVLNVPSNLTVDLMEYIRNESKHLCHVYIKGVFNWVSLYYAAIHNKHTQTSKTCSEQHARLNACKPVTVIGFLTYWL